MKHYMAGLRRMFDIYGRSSRAEFWLFLLFFLIIGIAVRVGEAALGLDVVTRDSIGYGRYVERHAPGIISWVILFPHIIAGVALQFRRLHDINRTARWFLLYILPPIGAITHFVFMLWPGTKGDNTYGPVPDINELGSGGLPAFKRPGRGMQIFQISLMVLVLAVIAIGVSYGGVGPSY